MRSIYKIYTWTGSCFFFKDNIVMAQYFFQFRTSFINRRLLKKHLFCQVCCYIRQLETTFRVESRFPKFFFEILLIAVTEPFVDDDGSSLSNLLLWNPQNRRNSEYFQFVILDSLGEHASVFN